MKNIRKYAKGASLVLATVVLTASTTPVLNTAEQPSPADIYFDESMRDGKFITIVNDENQVVYDGFVKNTSQITNPALRDILAKSDYLMGTQVSDYYLIQD